MIYFLSFVPTFPKIDKHKFKILAILLFHQHKDIVKAFVAVHHPPLIARIDNFQDDARIVIDIRRDRRRFARQKWTKTRWSADGSEVTIKGVDRSEKQVSVVVDSGHRE